jgi:hypothetical protein
MADNIISLLSNLAALVPHALPVAVAVAGLAATALIILRCFPTRMMKILDASLRDVDRLFYGFSGQNLEWQTEVDFASRLIKYYSFNGVALY